jgi:hypothetical protein
MKYFRESNRNEDWETSPEYQKEKAKAKATEVHLRLAEKHTEFLQQEEDGPNSRARSEEIAFIKLYTTSLRGLGLSKNTAERERCGDQQSRFREQLIQSYSAVNPDEAGGDDELWCHILNKWCYKDTVKAAHIIPYKGGPELMDALFGREPGTESELFSPLNGLLMSVAAEAKFDNHSLVIVPNLEDTATAAQIHDWHESSERGYKIRVVNPKSQEMQKRIGGELSKRTIDLDHQVIKFKSSFRPRSRYLYFHYLTAMLKTAWTFGDLSDALEHELGKRYWATPGPYLRGRFLKAFVTEVGDVFEPVVRGCALEEPKPEEVGRPSDLVGLGVAAECVVSERGTIRDDEEDGDETDEEEFEGFDEEDFTLLRVYQS